jgi:DTW domain-containing protein YfiP
VEVLILQHPREAARAKGSARLLALSLMRSCIVVGESFAEPQLQALLLEPLPALAASPGSRRSILLYPPTPQDKSLGLFAPPALTAQWLDDPAQLRLIVLDGTWRESRKMLYQNPPLQQLPRLALRDFPTSRYLIRKAHRSDQLSTLEASCAALAQLEGALETVRPLLAAFDGFVAQQLRYRCTKGRPDGPLDGR